MKVDHAPINAPKPKPVERPQIAAGETSEGWEYFTTRWRAYSRASKLKGADLGIQLLECLEPGLRRDLTRMTRGPAPIEEMEETDLLAAIKAMAVMQDSCLVATFAMARMTQDRGESCRSFASRLRGVACTCDFMETCPNCNHQVDCSESRVSNQLCIGVADPEIQEDLLEEITKRLTVEQVLHFIEKKTLGKRAASALKTPTTPSASALDDGDDPEDHVSSYKKLSRPTNNPKAPPKTTPKTTPRRPKAMPPPAQTKAHAASVVDKGMAHRPGRP